MNRASPTQLTDLAVFFPIHTRQSKITAEPPRMGQGNRIIAKFGKLWVYYALQSSLAAAVLFTLFLILGENRMVVISAMGASAFIVFALPTTASARAKVVIGSHLAALICGLIFYFPEMPHYIECPLAVAMTIFLMVALDIEHPPAAGTAIAVVINNASLDVCATVMISAVALSLCRYALKDHLRNLI